MRQNHPATGNHITPLAFMRRGPHPQTGAKRDANGFSVTLKDGRTEAEVIASEMTLKPKAVCALTAGATRSLTGLTTPQEGTVVTDVIQDKPDHANIVGLPEVPEDPPTTDAGRIAFADAEFLGGELAKRVQIVWSKESPASA